MGVPRSGTTLLRLMLDAHSELAIPPETGFLPHAIGTRGRKALHRLIVEARAWPDFQLDARELAAAFARVRPFAADEGLRCFYRSYARRFGKPRWGDKTPGYSLHMPAIASLLPEARFIHIIRDGRDVALSVRPLWFAPGRTMTELAADWQARITRARTDAARVGHYLEVRYEALVADAPSVLRRICAFIELRYEEAMLRYYQRAEARLAEHESHWDPDGRLVASRAQRLAAQRLTMQALEPSRVERWRRDMTAGERSAFEQVAGPMLRGLGYEAS